MQLSKPVRVTVGLALVALGLFLLVSLITHSPNEGPFPDYVASSGRSNACGVVGAYVSAYALALLGLAAYPLALLVGAAGVALTFRVRIPRWPWRLVGLVLAYFGFLLGLIVFSGAPYGQGGTAPGVAAGALGVLLGGWFYRVAGPAGTFITFVLSCILGAALMTEMELEFLSTRTGRFLKGAALRAWSIVRSRRTRRDEGEPEATVREPEESAEEAGEPVPTTPVALAEQEEEAAAVAPPAEPEVVTRRSRLEESAVEDDADFGVFQGRRRKGDYKLPPLNLLDEVPPGPVGEDEGEIRDKGRVLERTLGEFGVGAQVVRVQRGPVITMYELSLAPGTKVSKVESLSDDLAIALKAPNVRIVAPLPGRNTVGVEVPNTERELVGLRELIVESHRKAAGMAIPLFLGKDTAGNPLVLDLAACPHLLVAGATGSGKSVAINAIICSILMTRTPDQVQLLLVDPKSVEFSQYAQLPHLICPVLSDMKKAASVLKWACKKMDERYAILSRVGSRDITSYNELGEEAIIKRLDPEGDAVLDDVPIPMPHIVIIIDEFGELMMVAAKEVEGSVIRLSQKARAVGIHLVCATQRPSVDVITGLIKANLPARVAFQVSSKVDSRTILDRNGAELLLGRGDMLLLPPGTSRLVRAQGAYVSEAEVGRVVEFCAAQGGPQFKEDLRHYHTQQETGVAADELYDEAVRIVLETQRGSVSLLQRRLGIGYSRAARLIDMMAEAGVVGAYAGSQARRVLMTLEEWEKARAES